MKKAIALSMAAVTALTSVSVVAFADNENSEALAAAITTVKQRVDIPEELSEFSYRVSKGNLKETFNLTWSTPGTNSKYEYIEVQVCGGLILNYYSSDCWQRADRKLAKLSGDQLYKKAVAQVKKLNPTISSVLRVDRDSLSISTYNNTAWFDLVRMKNGVPVKNDEGRITVDKDTGALLSFDLNWHVNASFKDSKSALSEDKAKEKYADMIGIYPQYEFEYDYETRSVVPRLVYTQSDYGEINAFTGEKSDFDSDGYYDDEIADDTEEAGDTNAKGNPSTGGGSFTPEEQLEISKKLPYGSKAAIVKLLKDNQWLTYVDGMEVRSSDLYKVTTNGKNVYVYSADLTDEQWSEIEEDTFTVDECGSMEAYDDVSANESAGNESAGSTWHNVSISVNAETGEILSYSYSQSGNNVRYYGDSYDMNKADELAATIAASFAGDRFSEYKDYASEENSWTDNNKTRYSGSDHSWYRYANDILVSGDRIRICFDKDMKLTQYRINYTDVVLPKPTGMLTATQAMKKFWETSDLDMYYLAKVYKKKTQTVLVYGCSNSVNIDAFTGEPIYSWYTRKGKNDLSGIKDKKILKMAQKLDDHGVLISENKFSENDTVTYGILYDLFGGTAYVDEADRKITRSAALIAFTRSVTSDEVAKIKGIYKSPFSDISDDNPRVGYYAIAYGMGAFTEKKLDPTAYFTYGDMIRMVYALYSAENN
ncbi:propeptide PepSY amd peptidase M4 [Eubacterium sp. CAG:786]|nr:propeptide PepSY amd peptidase M4 [Eubacterium sp. CAG:786]